MSPLVCKRCGKRIPDRTVAGYLGAKGGAQRKPGAMTKERAAAMAKKRWDGHDTAANVTEQARCKASPASAGSASGSETP
jgi:hypothetical protein